MGNYVNMVPIGLSITTGVAGGIFAYLLRCKRQSYLLSWTVGWCLLALHYLCIGAEPWLGNASWLLMLDVWLFAAAALAFLHAARVYACLDPWSRAIVSAALVFALWTAAFFLGMVRVSPAFAVPLVSLATAWVFWQQSRKEDTSYDLLLAIAFLLQAPISWTGTVVAPPGSAGREAFVMFAFTEQLLVGLLMVMTVYEDERRRVERNVLALSNLNLTVSGFIGDEIQKTFTQALQRVLSAVDVPCGAIFLNNRDGGSPAAASVGLDPSFCSSAQESLAIGHLTQLVSGLGGLFAVRDIERDTAWAALEHEQEFVGLRNLAVAHGLHTLACITLQAKDSAFGVLLLGARDRRSFAPSELRLMLGLGQQIGMAVENSYLLEQSRRRSDELRALNEVGRALGSLLDPDALFEKLFAEVQRLFRFSDFYIALFDAAEGQVSFELEVADGVRVAKRSRPVGNHLMEYILRTRQPVLIRENLEEGVRALGIAAKGKPGSFCGVPLIVGERAIGVIAARGSEERLYDQHEVELLRVLASEASIAIENARLFREQQTKSRQMTLLNNISRDAITTLNPDEMLANIAEQLGQGLSFDHMGIGVLDYENKEVVVRAEAGRRRGALGLRMPLGDSLVGHVASTGRTLVTHAAASGASGAPVLPDTFSSVALPILYADQLHGVLYVETVEPFAFNDEDLLMLHTLADLIASALHHALTFQKAQEQAITDGLTGVKTHRFFMEALAGEWKRSTRMSRPFSLALLDLDRFKLVNDLHGHPEGDLVLKRTARILESSCRRSDVVARYGGDEFIVVMPETSIEQALQLAEKFRRAIAGDAFLAGKTVSASVGVASFPLHAATATELIQVADASMYLSKHRGGNAVSAADSSDSSRTQEWKRDVLEAYLGVALKRRFVPGPQAFDEIRALLEQFAHSLRPDERAAPASGNAHAGGHAADVPRPLPAAVAETVTSLALAVDAKDHYTQGHSQKVAAYSALIAERLCLAPDEIAEVRLAGTLHDIGKVGIPEAILNKAGPLDPDEWSLMKDHARLGDELLAPLEDLARVRPLVRHHHEMFDGSGYPHGLSGEDIPLGARIVAVADAFDTITSERTYKKPRTTAAALAELQRCAGAQFDPDLVRLFVDALQLRSQAAAGSAEVSAGQEVR